MTSDETTYVTPSLAVTFVRALMDRHGLPKYRQSPWLADALGLSYSQAHRRMTGASPWSLEDLARVAGLFGESLADLVSAAAREETVKATLVLGPAALPCNLTLGARIDTPHPHSVVAVLSAAGWSVVPGRDAGDAAYAIKRLEAAPSLSTRKVIAVLDDDPDITNSICTHFHASGYDARAYFKTSELLAAWRPITSMDSSSTGSSGRRAHST